MIKIYNFFKLLFDFILNLFFVIQIVLVILIFLTTAYWFFDLAGSTLFSFAEPIATAMSNIVKYFYNRDVMVGGTFIDSSLLLFNFCAVIIVFIISKLKYYIIRAKEFIDLGIDTRKTQLENKFNEELQNEASRRIKTFKNAVLLIKFEAKSMQIDNIWGGDEKAGVVEKEEEAFKIFYSSVKHFDYCKFAKNGGKLAIFINDFDKIDSFLFFAEQSIKRIAQNMKSKKWNLITYMAIDCYDEKTNPEKSILPNLEQLLNLKHKDVILCFGNFNLRHNMLKEPIYYSIDVKGDYDLNGINKIYTLVKKN